MKLIIQFHFSKLDFYILDQILIIKSQKSVRFQFDFRGNKNWSFEKCDSSQAKVREILNWQVKLLKQKQKHVPTFISDTHLIMWNNTVLDLDWDDSSPS